MKLNKRIFASITMIFISIILIFIAFYMRYQILLIIGGISLVVSALFTTLIASLDLFRRDKELDIEALKKSGLTIVKCQNCDKNNVLEDKYCIYCGDQLVKS